MKEEKKEIVTEKKSNKKIFFIGGCALIVLAAIAVLFFVLFLMKPKYKVTVNAGGGTITRDIVIEDNVIKSLPEVKAPEGKQLVVWVNKNKEAVRPGITLEGDDEFTPVFEDPEGVKVTVSFETGTDEKIDSIVITMGTEIILPVKPNSYKDWKFLYWVDKDGYSVLNTRRIYEDTTIYAYWFKPAKETFTVKYETGTDEKIEPIEYAKGSKYVLPSLDKEKEGYVFRGWVDSDGSLITVDSTVEKDITLKANWVEPYTCPEDCVPNEDGKTCVKTSSEAPQKKMICNGREKYGKCYDTSHPICEERQCAEGDGFGNQEIGVAVGESYCCAPAISKTEQTVCPSGYNLTEDQCVKIETLECTEN